MKSLTLASKPASPQKMSCSGLEDSTFFDSLKWAMALTFLSLNLENRQKPLFFGGYLKKNFEDHFFFDNTCALCPWSWHRTILFLALRGSVLEKLVLGLRFFCVLVHGLEGCVLDSISDKKKAKADLHFETKKNQDLNAPLRVHRKKKKT